MGKIDYFLSILIRKNSDPLFWRENETGNGNGGADALFETLYKGEDQ